MKIMDFRTAFLPSLFNTGIDKPNGYSEETIDEINKDGTLTKSETSLKEGEMPNIIFVQLESFFDPRRWNSTALQGPDSVPEVIV